MPARRVRSGAMFAGAALSALAHACLIALALVAPPWLRPHRERPAPVVAVALVTPAAFDAAIAALTRPAPAPVVAPPAPVAPVRSPPPVPPAATPDAEADGEALPTLAPGFNADAPLGLGPPPAAVDLPAHRPHARPGLPAAAAAPPPVSAAEAAAAFATAVREAVARQFVEPAAGTGGAVRLALIVNREGRLLAARLVASSGAASLDRAAIEAARTARLPEMPEEMPNARTTVEFDLVFAPGG